MERTVLRRLRSPPGASKEGAAMSEWTTAAPSIGTYWLSIAPECDEETYNKAQHRIKEAGKQQPLFTPKAAQATQLQLG